MDKTYGDVLEGYHLKGVCMFVFGGAVRDALRAGSSGQQAYTPADIDVVYGAAPAQMKEIAKELGFRPVKLLRPGKIQWGNTPEITPEGRCTASVVFEGAPLSPSFGKIYSRPTQSRFRAREEKSPQLVSNSLKDHLLTMDYCCNAVFFEPRSETFLDPSGFGVKDCLHQLLRIPVPESDWPQWLKLTGSLKLLRFWKMKALGYSAGAKSPSTVHC